MSALRSLSPSKASLLNIRRTSLRRAALPQEARSRLLPGQSPAEEFATLAHELAHEMMHRDERRSSTSKRSRETEAEAVAFVVCHAIGLETGSAAQDYIQLYEGDAKLLTESLEHIQHTANSNSQRYRRGRSIRATRLKRVIAFRQPSTCARCALPPFSEPTTSEAFCRLPLPGLEASANAKETAPPCPNCPTQCRPRFSV